MEAPFQVLFIIIALLIVIAIYILVGKYFLYPLFFKPKLSPNETYRFFEDKNLFFIEQRPLNKSERKINPFNSKKGFSLMKIFSERSEYLAVTSSKNNAVHYTFFWIELIKFHAIHVKFFAEMTFSEKYKNRNLNFKAVTNEAILIKLREEFEPKFQLLSTHCPACSSKISKTDMVCPNCDLSLM